MSKLYAGIDNGISGALAVLREGRGPLFYPMPALKVDGETRVDPRALRGLLAHVSEVAGVLPADWHVVAEAAQTFTAGVLALRSTWHSWATVESVLRLEGYPYTPVNPRQWQKEMLAGVVFKKKGKAGKEANDTKAASIAVAKGLFPGANLRRTTRAKTDDCNFSDAVLMAEWGRRQKL